MGVTLGLMIWQRSSKMKLRVNSVIIIMLAFVLSNIVSILHASHKLAALRESFKYIEYETLLVLGFLVASAVSGDLVEQATASASTILLLFVSTSVVLQLLTQSEVSGVWFNNVAIPRLSGALEGPNQLSGLLEILLPVVILIPNNRLITRETKRVSLALGAFALVLSQSRFGIALVIAIGVTLFIKKKRALAYAFGCGTLVGTAILGFWFISAASSLFTGKPSSIRIVISRPQSDSRNEASQTENLVPLKGPKVRFVGSKDPMVIEGARAEVSEDKTNASIRINVITTSNCAAVVSYMGSKIYYLKRLHYGFFSGNIIVERNTQSTRHLEVVAIRADGLRLSKVIIVKLRPIMVRTIVVSGISGATALIRSRIVAPSSTQDPGTVGTRSQLWKAGEKMISHNWKFGIGAGNFEYQLADYSQGLRTNASSYWLQTLAEQGVAGLFILTLLVASIIVKLVSSRPAGWIQEACLISTIVTFLHQVIDTLFFYPKVADYYWVLVGIALGSLAQRSLSEVDTQHHPSEAVTDA